MKRTMATVAALLMAALMVATGARPASALSGQTGPDLRTPAWFEDHWIDLAVDWEGARACDVGSLSDVTVVCFRDERALDAALESATNAATLASTCSSSLRLYSGTSYSGTVLNLGTRLTLIDLSLYSFDNLTSSYKVGACDAELHSGASQSSSTYPGNTTAYAQSATMLTGWDNFVSSVYIL